jgi:hypothetical protein
MENYNHLLTLNLFVGYSFERVLIGDDVEWNSHGLIEVLPDICTPQI